jgi:hypothetical protein
MGQCGGAGCTRIKTRKESNQSSELSSKPHDFGEWQHCCRLVGKHCLSLKRTQRIWRSDFSTNPGNERPAALARLVSLRVPGAIEAVDKLPSDANAVLTWLPSRPPAYRGASHGFVRLDEAARLTDLNVPVATQKRFAVQTMFSLGTMS